MDFDILVWLILQVYLSHYSLLYCSMVEPLESVNRALSCADLLPLRLLICSLLHVFYLSSEASTILLIIVIIAVLAYILNFFRSMHALDSRQVSHL